jgi:hypothetical protein
VPLFPWQLACRLIETQFGPQHHNASDVESGGGGAMSKLRDRLEDFKTTFESGAPPYNATPEVVATMHRATAELKASGIENTALKVGGRAPDFTLFNQDHVEVASFSVT